MADETAKQNVPWKPHTEKISFFLNIKKKTSEANNESCSQDVVIEWKLNHELDKNPGQLLRRYAAEKVG